MRRKICALVTLYQYLVSPWLGNHCRYYPSCSVYMRDAVLQHGVLRGCAMGVCRLLRCHPLHAGGYDPVPNRDE